MKKDILLGIGIGCLMLMLTLGSVVAYNEYWTVDEEENEFFVVRIDYQIPPNLANGLAQHDAIHKIEAHKHGSWIYFYPNLYEFFDTNILKRDLQAFETTLSINSLRSAEWIGIAIPNCIAVSPWVTLDFKPQLRDGEWVLIGQENDLCSYYGGTEQ